MKIFPKLAALFRKKELEAEMAEEMRLHLEHRIKENMIAGLSPDEARNAAQWKFGNVGVVQEYVREQRGWRWLERLLQDMRYAVRALWRSPGFTLLAIITLGLGIGANTSMFNGVHSVLWKPLPYADGARLIRVFRTTAQGVQGNVSPADFLELQRAQGGYGEIAGYTLGEASFSEPGQPAEIAVASRITANLFSTLGVRPELGRDFRPEEAILGRDRLIIISQRCWQTRFGGRADIIGHTLRVDGEPHEIIGVMPAAFNDWRHLGAFDLFRPLVFDQEKAADRTTAAIRPIGRRSDRFSRIEADAFIANFGARLARDFPEVNAGSTWRAVTLLDTVAGPNGPLMFTMFVGLSGFVLLIACSNLANLLLARTMARAREFAVRSAMGASRLQLLRPLITESLLLALSGSVCALFVARWVGDWLSVLSTDDNGRQVGFALGWHAFGWALAAALVTALAFGLAPALFAMRLDLNCTLKSGARGATSSRGQQRLRSFLIVGQFALAMVLLAGAALFVRGFDELNNRRSGWESEHLVTGTILFPAAAYPSAEKIATFQRLALERLESLPGVASASLSSFTPVFNWPVLSRFVVEGRKLPEPGHEPAAVVNSASPHYFETFGTRLLAGRAFNERDTAASAKVFIINQAMARSLFGGETPVGRRIAPIGAASQWGEIVGVVGDVVSVVPEAALVKSQLYQPLAQGSRPRCEVAVRVAGVAPAGLVDRIRAVMMELDPDLPVRQLQPAEATIGRANYQLAILRDVLVLMAVLGLGLAALGVYGVIARTTAQRTPEFAIRLALGAQVRDITRLVLGSGVKLSLLGATLGLLGAFGVVRVLAAVFPSMQLDNVPVIAGATIFLILIALIASYLPARNASKINPIEALRIE